MLIEFGIERRPDCHLREHLTKLGEVRSGLNRLRCFLSGCLSVFLFHFCLLGQTRGSIIGSYTEFRTVSSMARLDTASRRFADECRLSVALSRPSTDWCQSLMPKLERHGDAQRLAT